MNNTVKAAVITGCCGIIASIISAIIGINTGKSMEQKIIQNEINTAMGEIINIIGDDNTVTINDIKELIEDYRNLQTQNDSLIAQNAKYFDDLTETNDQIDKLQDQISNIPTTNFSNLALSIDGKDIAINSNNSMVTIDGRDYFSKEIVEKSISVDKSITIKNDTVFIGNVIIEKANLFDQRIMDQNAMFMADAITDSYGNNYSHALYAKTTYTGGNNITYYLDGKYSLLRFNVSIRENAEMLGSGILTIKADGEVVYTSKTLNKLTEPFTELDIPINNCKLLYIEYSKNYYADCIISDAIVYN